MRKPRLVTSAALCGTLLTLTYSAAAQNTPPLSNARPQTQAETAAAGTTAAPGKTPNDTAGEIEALRRRLEDVESQNRALTESLRELKTRLDELNPPSSHSTPATLTTQSGAGSAQAPAQAGQEDKNQPVRWSELLGQDSKIKLYGFLRLDLDFDSQHPNNTQTPLFITTPDVRAAGMTNGDYSIHPRLTRFGVDFAGPRLAGLRGAKLSGKLETDFENGGSESRQIIRIRHAYLRLDWKEASLLAGQTWDVVSPLFPTVNNDTLMWNAGNVGDRRPQLRAAYEPSVGRGKLSFVGGVGLTGAIDAQDLDNNGFRDGEESVFPDVQARVGYSRAFGKDRTASVGFSGFYGFEKTARPVAGRTEFRAQLFNVDFTLPVAARLSLRGEGWWGRNMSDMRGGAGQGVNITTGREIRGRGGWAEANVKLSRYLTVSPGFSTDDPVDGDIPTNGRTRNRAFYIANRITPAAAFVLGADYLRWKTNYKGLLPGVNNRVNIFIQYNY
jgi:hypothetical protein